MAQAALEAKQAEQDTRLDGLTAALQSLGARLGIPVELELGEGPARDAALATATATESLTAQVLALEARLTDLTAELGELREVEENSAGQLGSCKARLAILEELDLPAQMGYLDRRFGAELTFLKVNEPTHPLTHSSTHSPTHEATRYFPSPLNEPATPPITLIM